MNYNNTPINWSKVNDIVSSAKKILLTTHENPDGDGLGSEVALYHHLIEIGKDVKIINCPPTPVMYDFINKSNCIETYDENLNLVLNSLEKKCQFLQVNAFAAKSRTHALVNQMQYLTATVTTADARLALYLVQTFLSLKAQ